MKKLLLLAFMAMMMLALMAPAAFAQDDDDLDDDGYDDDDGTAVQAAPLPDTGGPALLIPVAGAALLGAGAVGLVRRKRS